MKLIVRRRKESLSAVCLKKGWVSVTTEGWGLRYCRLHLTVERAGSGLPSLVPCDNMFSSVMQHYSSAVPGLASTVVSTNIFINNYLIACLFGCFLWTEGRMLFRWLQFSVLCSAALRNIQPGGRRRLTSPLLSSHLRTLQSTSGGRMGWDHQPSNITYLIQTIDVMSQFIFGKGVWCYISCVQSVQYSLL